MHIKMTQINFEKELILLALTGQTLPKTGATYVMTELTDFYRPHPEISIHNPTLVHYGEGNISHLRFSRSNNQIELLKGSTLYHLAAKLRRNLANSRAYPLQSLSIFPAIGILFHFKYGVPDEIFHFKFCDHYGETTLSDYINSYPGRGVFFYDAWKEDNFFLKGLLEVEEKATEILQQHSQLERLPLDEENTAIKGFPLMIPCQTERWSISYLYLPARMVFKGKTPSTLKKSLKEDLKLLEKISRNFIDKLNEDRAMLNSKQVEYIRDELNRQKEEAMELLHRQFKIMEKEATLDLEKFTIEKLTEIQKRRN